LRGGEVAFVAPTGRGLVPLHLEDPVPNAAITSPWGWRIHPVLGVPKFHRGVDFGAALGTPVRAAAAGTIASIGWRGNCGRQIRLRHSSRLETTYAHLSRFARHLHPGSRVRRGQTIGYVGASGMATGPHLYFEVLVDGEQIDPAHNPGLPIQLTGANLSQFQAYADRVASSVSR
jgi:murein DD-endopeptidase MepM/ murein hydrolase activator NlpD